MGLNGDSALPVSPEEPGMAFLNPSQSFRVGVAMDIASVHADDGYLGRDGGEECLGGGIPGAVVANPEDVGL